MSTPYIGISFPKMFNSSTKTTNVVGKEDDSISTNASRLKKKSGKVEKISSDIRLLLAQQVREVLFNPSLGVDLESILFADDILVTRDFIYSFVEDAITRNMTDVRLKDVTVQKDGEKLTASLFFIYEQGDVYLNLDLSLKGALYE